MSSTTPAPRETHSSATRWCARVVAVVVFAVAAWRGPALWFGCRHRQSSTTCVNADQLSSGMAKLVATRWQRRHFVSGSPRFNGEWLLFTYMGAALGFAQLALADPPRRATHLQRMGTAIAQILEPRVRAFHIESWREDPLKQLSGTRDHGAYLLYLNLVLSLHTLLDPRSPHRTLNDAVSDALLARFRRSPTGLIQSYPGESFPADCAAGIASIALNAKRRGIDRRPFLRQWAAQLRRRYLQRGTGLLVQALWSRNGAAPRLGDYRGSGTVFASYLLSFALPQLSAELWTAARRQLLRCHWGFCAMREYRDNGGGDVDSGPLILGFSLSASAFAIAAARSNGDHASERGLCTLANLVGVPGTMRSVPMLLAGGVLGSSLLFALRTAQPAGAFLKAVAP